MTEKSVITVNGHWNRNVILQDITGLRPHPLSVKIYGLPTANENLLTSVETFGVLSAVVINAEGFVISGTSRHYAAQKAHEKYPEKGFDKIPAILFEGSRLDEQILVIESNRQRIKLPSQLGREFNEWFRIEQELAEQRQKTGVNLPLKSAGGDARERAARLVNLGRTKAEQLGKLVVKADSGNRRAKDLLIEVDAEKISVSAAYSQIDEKQKPADCPVCQKSFPSISQMKKHARRGHQLEDGALREAMGYPRKQSGKEFKSRESQGISSLVDDLMRTKLSQVRNWKFEPDADFCSAGTALVERVKVAGVLNLENHNARRDFRQLLEGLKTLSNLHRGLENALAVSGNGRYITDEMIHEGNKRLSDPRYAAAQEAAQEAAQKVIGVTEPVGQREVLTT